MFLSLIRTLFGFAMACLAAALVQVLFVVTPAEIAGLKPTDMADRLSSAGVLVLLAATHTAVFAAPFWLLLAAFGEWLAIRSWIYYALAGIAIAMAGFTAQYASETGSLTIVNDYALRAFLAAGFAAGIVYWLTAGRSAGRRPVEPDGEPTAERWRSTQRGGASR
jgi:hypothetical protein